MRISLLLWLFVALPLAFGQANPVSLAAIDREFGTQQLLTVPSRPFGDLVADGEFACDRLPFSACAYEDQGWIYYYNSGRLISKTFEFSDLQAHGPFGIAFGDGPAQVVEKLSPYVEGVEPILYEGEAGVALIYSIDCSPYLCRLDWRIENGFVASVRLYQSDAI